MTVGVTVIYADPEGGAGEGPSRRSREGTEARGDDQGGLQAH